MIFGWFYMNVTLTWLPGKTGRLNSYNCYISTLALHSVSVILSSSPHSKVGWLRLPEPGYAEDFLLSKGVFSFPQSPGACSWGSPDFLGFSLLLQDLHLKIENTLKQLIWCYLNKSELNYCASLVYFY